MTLVCGMCIVGLAVHFSCSVASVFPPNPLTAPMRQQVNRYLNPYFAQSWRLFAPDPGGPSFVMLVQCRPRTSQEPTAWVDVTAPLLAATRPNRLHPARAILRLNKGAIARFIGVRDPFVDYLEEKLRAEPDNHELREVVESLKARATPQASPEEKARPMIRLATAYCETIVGEAELAEVRSRIDVLVIPPFSRRKQPIDRSGVRSYVLPWSAAESVAPLKL